MSRRIDDPIDPVREVGREAISAAQRRVRAWLASLIAVSWCTGQAVGCTGGVPRDGGHEGGEAAQRATGGADEALGQAEGAAPPGASPPDGTSARASFGQGPGSDPGRGVGIAPAVASGPSARSAATVDANVDAEDLVAVLDALPSDTRGVVVVRDVAIVTDLAGTIRSMLSGVLDAEMASAVPDGGGAVDPSASPSVTPPTASGPGRTALGGLAAAWVGIHWPVRRGAVVAWTATSVHLTLPAEELLALEPLVAAAAGGQATASSACTVSSLRHAWVTCELALPPGMLARASAAPDERARRVVALRAALAELAMAPRPELAPSLRAAALAPDGVSVVRVRLVSDDAGFSADVHMPPALAGGFAPFTPRLPTMLAAAGMDPSYAWWSIAPSDVRSALEGLPSPLARAARTVTGEALVIAAEAPARAELLLGIDDPGPTLGAFGMLSLAGTFGLDIAAILPGWSWRLAKVPAFDQQFEVLSLERAAPHEAPLAAEGALEGASWDDAERGFVTPTVDALWVALGASLEELDASPLAARHGLRLERGVSAAPLPPRAKADLAAGRVGALASLDVFALLDPRAVAATRRLWRTFDAPSERAWGELLGSATRVVRSQLSPAARLVVWSCPAVRAASPAAALSPAVASAIPSTGPSAGAAARALASNAGESLHVHVELCLACGADDAASIEGGAGVDRDWRTPARALAAMAASYAALLALTKPH